jgi:hypothetical protein
MRRVFAKFCATHSDRGPDGEQKGDCCDRRVISGSSRDSTWGSYVTVLRPWMKLSRMRQRVSESYLTTISRGSPATEGLLEQVCMCRRPILDVDYIRFLTHCHV